MVKEDLMKDVRFAVVGILCILLFLPAVLVIELLFSKPLEIRIAECKAKGWVVIEQTGYYRSKNYICAKPMENK